MSATKSTPGPWRLHMIGKSQIPVAIVTYRDGGLQSVLMPPQTPSTRTPADLALACAAPELFEALSLYVAACGNTAASVDRELVQEAWRRASAALAKAQGK